MAAKRKKDPKNPGYREQYGVVILCADEARQRRTYEAPPEAVVDEFSSVVDRQIARIGALAFQKAWRRTGGKCVLLSCHHDILDWLEPDWVFDTATCEFTGGRRRRRPEIPLEIWRTDWRYWPVFEPHHYLKAPLMVAAHCYVGTVSGEPVAHVAVSPKLEVAGMRACRLVILPEWQGAGIGLRFLEGVCEYELQAGRFHGRAKAVYFHTSHPGLSAVLRRAKRWRQISAVLWGGNKAKSKQSLATSRQRAGENGTVGAGYGGHFRAVQGFKFALE